MVAWKEHWEFCDISSMFDIHDVFTWHQEPWCELFFAPYIGIWVLWCSCCGYSVGIDGVRISSTRITGFTWETGS